MKVLSLFDGMACGALALQAAGIEIESYDAFEYDVKSVNSSKGRPYGFAALTASHNFPFIKQHGDVFAADFTQFKDIDILLAGFPCTKFSIAQKKDRETKPYSGEGWELFEQTWKAVCEVKPKYFLLENNKSMAKAVQQEISKIIGFAPVLINSALVSAQHRQRIYWVGRRNPDGTYSKVNVEQPIDRGILLKDVLDGNTDREKARSVICSIGRTTTREYFQKHQGTMTFEPVNTTADGKSQTIKSQAQQTNEDNIIVYAGGTFGASGVAEPVNPLHSGKARCVTAGYSNKGATHILESNYSDNPHKQQWDSVSEPVRIGTYPNEAKNQKKHDSQQYRIYSTEGKSVTLCGNGGGMGAKTGLYAIPVEFDGDIPTKAISAADGKIYRVHKVENGLITIKGKQYPINLADGYYIIRKLTVSECKRLQTVPEWYEFPVSDSQAYKMLGNGWTVEVIAHLLNSCLSGKVDVQPEFGEQIRFF